MNILQWNKIGMVQCVRFTEMYRPNELPYFFYHVQPNTCGKDATLPSAVKL